PIKGEPMKGPFVGRRDESGKLIGVVPIAGSTYPAALEKTDAKALGQRTPGPDVQLKTRALKAALDENDPAEKVKKLDAILAGKPDPGTLFFAIANRLSAAVRAKRPADEVRKMVDHWQDEARRFGEDLASTARSQALRSLSG